MHQHILLKDEGVGVKTVEKLLAEYSFSANVELMDGGTLGMALVEPIMAFDRLIVVDAVVNSSDPPPQRHPCIPVTVSYLLWPHAIEIRPHHAKGRPLGGLLRFQWEGRKSI